MLKFSTVCVCLITIDINVNPYNNKQRLYENCFVFVSFVFYSVV